jgi:hypothetical protein
MKNEIDQTVERIGQLPGGYTIDSPPFTLFDGNIREAKLFVCETSDLKALATAYTQLKADLATPSIVRAESHCVWLKDGTKVRLNCTDEGNFELEVADTLTVTTAAIGKE